MISSNKKILNNDETSQITQKSPIRIKKNPSISNLNSNKKKINVQIKIEQISNKFIFYQNDKKIGQLREQININKEAFPMFKQIQNSMNNCSKSFKKRFEPPLFGITTLGNSHGFDTAGCTSGFIVWINGKGIMVDPPPYSSSVLKIEGIHPSLIEKIILSHCHADHDSGAFHKILEAEPIELLSTETILRSFLRKYSAITGAKISEVNKLAKFRGVKIGHPVNIYGAKFNFFYSFHSIPAIGFDVEYLGKSFYFSGDTYFDPDNLYKIYKEKGLFSKERFESLSHKNLKKYDLVFHEAGIPPIHTPQKALIKSTQGSKGQLFLYHCTHSSINHKGLNLVPVGLHNTLHLINKDSRHHTEDKDIFRTNLELFASISLVSWLPINRILELCHLINNVKYSPDSLIIKAGSFGDKFYIVKKGNLKIYTTGEKSFEKIIGPCDYFGESSIFEDGKRLANVKTLTEVELIEIHKFDFFWVFSDSSLPDASGPETLDPQIKKIGNLSKIRKAKMGEFINENSFIRSLSENQKNQVNMYLKEIITTPGQTLWKKDEDCPFCFFVKSGKFQMIAPQKCVPKNFVLKRGSLVGDFPNLLQKINSRSGVKCITNGSILIIEKDKLEKLIHQFPSIRVCLREKFLIY